MGIFVGVRPRSNEIWVVTGGKDVESEIGATTARGCPMVVGFRDLGPPYDVEPIPR